MTDVPISRQSSGSDEGLQQSAALRLAHECGAVSYTPGVLRAVRGVSLTFEQLDDFARRLHALASASAGWQDIESAPKGVNVLLHSPRHKLPSVADWADYCRINQPGFTHWMLLPPAPKAAEAAEAKGGVE